MGPRSPRPKVDYNNRERAKAPKTHYIICEKCGKQLKFNQYDVAHINEAIGPFEIWQEHVRCDIMRRWHHCGHRNIIAKMDIDGKIHRKEVYRIE